MVTSSTDGGFPQPDAAIIIEVGAPESNGAEAPRPDGVDVGSVETFDIRRRVRTTAIRGIPDPGASTVSISAGSRTPRRPISARRSTNTARRTCAAPPGSTNASTGAKPIRTGPIGPSNCGVMMCAKLRDAAVDVTTCVRLAETAWDSSHAYPQYLVSARAERQLLWDLADRADCTAELLEEIRDEQRASKDAERDFWEEIAWDAAFTVASLLLYGVFGMAARLGRAAVAAAGTSALGRLATIVTNIATKVRALPIYLRAPITGLAWGTGGAANYVAQRNAR